LKTIQLINDSYEIVKQEIEDTFECCRKIEENINTKVEGSHLGCCLDFVSAVGCCSDQNSRWKQAMEDCKVYQDYYGNDKGRAFVALYDGYNGSYAASVAANELHYLLLMEMAKFDKTIKCKCTFNMLERNDVTKYDLIESPAKPCQHKRQLHRQSANFLHQVIYTCEELDYEGTNHLSSHHPIRKDLSTNKQSEVAHGVAEVYTLCTYSIYSVYIQYILCVHTVYTLCTYSIYCMYIQCILCVHAVYTLCTYSIYSLYIQYILCVHTVYTLCT